MIDLLPVHVAGTDGTQPGLTADLAKHEHEKNVASRRCFPDSACVARREKDRPSPQAHPTKPARSLRGKHHGSHTSANCRHPSQSPRSPQQKCSYLSIHRQAHSRPFLGVRGRYGAARRPAVLDAWQCQERERDLLTSVSRVPIPILCDLQPSCLAFGTAGREGCKTQTLAKPANLAVANQTTQLTLHTRYPTATSFWLLEPQEPFRRFPRLSSLLPPLFDKRHRWFPVEASRSEPCPCQFGIP
jgi:hypothetical protein